MKNRDQIRARNALEALSERSDLTKGQQGGDALTGFPAFIIGNGLLATIAYSIAKGAGYPHICDAIARHLADPEISLIPKDSGSTNGLRDYLAESESEVLRLCTAESLAYLNYLRRFAKAAN